jgi:hypothetical protein
MPIVHQNATGQQCDERRDPFIGTLDAHDFVHDSAPTRPQASARVA